MMMQKKLNITPGDWLVYGHSIAPVSKENDQSYGMQMYVAYVEACYWPYHYSDNATLIADAGTTYNRTGLLPSELAAQRDELLEVLKRVREYWQYSQTNPVSTQTIDAAIKRCQP